MNNAFLDFYGKNNISPTRQDLSDYEKHKLRRENLYRHLGILPDYFTDKNILEVGAGGGYNSLVVANYKPRKYVILEPNPKGFEQLQNNFGINKKFIDESDNIELRKIKIEEYQPTRLFDIIMCENMIPFMEKENQHIILNKMDSLLKPQGMMILTCVDEISHFFESVKRYFAYQLTKDLPEFKDKVEVLIKAFKSHKDTLPGSSRLVEDWATDNFLNPAVLNLIFSFSDYLNFFRNKYDYYSTSPRIINDYRWYKAIPEDTESTNFRAVEEYQLIKHNLMHYKYEFEKRRKKDNEFLSECCAKIRELVRIQEQENTDVKNEFRITIQKIINNTSDLGWKTAIPLKEILQILRKERVTIEDMSDKFQNFREAFGRGTVYLSLIKK